MDYNEFAEKIKNKYPEYKDFDNKELSRKIIAKYPEYESQVTFDDLETKKTNPVADFGKGLVQGLGSFPTAIGQKVGNKLRPLVGKKELTQEEIQQKVKQNPLSDIAFGKPETGAGKVGYTIGNLAPAFLLPEVKAIQGAGMLPKVANMGLTGAYQGGLVSGSDAIINNGDLGDVAMGTALGGGIGAGLPAVAKGLNPLVQKTLNNPTFKQKVGGIVEAITSVPAKFTERALEKEYAGNSLFKGKFDSDTAYRGIETKLKEAKRKLPSKEYYKEQYKKLGESARQKLNANLKPESYFDEEYNKLGKEVLSSIDDLNVQAGEKVNEAVNNLRLSDTTVDSNELKNIVKNTFDQYQGGQINPARNLTGSLENDLNKLIDKGIEGTDDFIASKYPKMDNTLSDIAKQKEEEAFRILEQATGKNRNWLRSQLKADSPTMGTGKRQEFIEELIGDKVDDKISPDFISELQYYRPRTSDYGDITAGYEVASSALDDILKNRISANLSDPLTQSFHEANYDYYNLLKKISENLDNPNVYENAYTELEKITRNLPEEAIPEYTSKLTSDLEQLYKKGGSIRPIDLQKIKEQVGKMVRWNDETARSYHNPILEQIYGQLESKLSELSPELAEANNLYSKILGVEKATGGLNPTTIANKLSDFNNSQQIRSGINKSFEELNNLLPKDKQFLNRLNALNKQRANQQLLQSDITSSVLNDISRFDNAPYSTQDALINVAPEEVANYTRLSQAQKYQDEMLKPINNANYERNPKLLANRNDLAAEEALDYLQKQSGINFMDDLNDIRAREALEAWLPGQGGGSGSAQGAANLVRSALGGSGLTAAATLHNPLLAAPFSLMLPQVGAKGTIKNLGRLYRMAGNQEVNPALQRILPPIAAKTPLLYGGVEYNEGY